MARYGREYGRSRDRGFDAGRFDRGYGGEYGAGRDIERGGRGDYYGGGAHYRDTGAYAGAGYGGMRSDNEGTNWNEFPGEGGWFGPGYEGYPSGGYARPYRRGRTLETERGGWGAGQGQPRQRQRGPRQGRQGRGRNVRASEIMTRDPETVTPDATLSTVAKDMRDRNVGIIPVVESEDSRRLEGVITDRDIAVRAVAEGKGGNTKVSTIMSGDVETVNQNDHVNDVIRVMKQSKVRRVPVTDREGRLVGIIAQADLAVDFAGHDRGREVQTEETIETISEPGHPKGRGPARA